MKIRSDFVSNSSSSSFIIFKQQNLENFLVKYSKLFSDLHLLFLKYSTTDYFNKCKEILKNCDQKWIDYKTEELIIAFRNPKIIVEKQKEFIECFKLSKSLEIMVCDTWGDHVFRLYQILTLLEDNGFDFHELYDESNWVKMSEEIHNEN